MISNYTCFMYLILLQYVFAQLHTNEYAVYIPEGEEVANEIASKHGFTNRGQIGSLKGYYLYEHSDIGKRSLSSNTTYSNLLKKEKSVLWSEQQIVKRRVKRSVFFNEFTGYQDPLYPEQWFLHKGAVGNYDMNVIPVWKDSITGKGVVITILDDGLQKDHPDLAQNYDKNASWDINDSDEDPSPKDNEDNKHGTRCAGEIAAVANNEFCGVGVAYNASIGGVRMLDGSVTDTIEARALSLRPNYIHIYSASWGPTDDGETVDGPGKLAKLAFKEGVTKGRNGLGSIFVWASGNGGNNKDNCNCDGYATSIYTISISSATQSGLRPWYSEQCSSSLAATYSSGTLNHDGFIVTIDVDYSYNTNRQNGVSPNLSKLCTKKHTGSSAAAPIAAGICALALEANPQLTWRDIQHLIVATSRYEPLSKEQGWVTTALGRKVSPNFGYGLMDAAAMVNLAKIWRAVPRQFICKTKTDSTNRIIPEDRGIPLEANMNSTGCKNSKSAVIYLEHVQLNISLLFYPRGNLRITLISPLGTPSDILYPRPFDKKGSFFHNWIFMSVHFWGETPKGIWKLQIVNDGELMSSGTGTLLHWSLIFYGTKYKPQYFNHQEDIKKSVEHSFPVRGVFETPGYISNPCLDKGLFHLTSNDEQNCVEDCPVHQYKDLNEYVCRICDDSCSSCFGSSFNNCLTCQKNFLLKNMCVNSCPEGFYADRTMHICHPCLSTCKTCGEISTCLQCHKGLYLYEQKCVNTCPLNTYPHHGTCVNCHKSCSSCYGRLPKDCLSCPSLKYFHNGTCVSECPEGYYSLHNFCVKCYRSCKSCIDGNSCVDCSPHFEHNSQTDCYYSYICAKGSCDDCGCSQCRNPDTGECVICNQNLFWLEGKCVGKCPDNHYVYRDECTPCDKMCASCNYNGECFFCRKNLVLFQGRCLVQCPPRFYSNEKRICEACHGNCLECSSHSEHDCTSCQKGYFLVNQTCMERCPDGFYAVTDGIGLQCIPCFYSCRTCLEFGSNKCKRCHINFTFSNGACTPCSDDEYFNQATEMCHKCHKKCERCFGPNSDNCLSCYAPLRLNKLKHTCLPCCYNINKSEIECCSCSEDLDVCLHSDQSQSTPSTSAENYVENEFPMKNVVSFVIGISCLSFLVFGVIFGVLQAKSAGWCSKLKKLRYQRIPNNLSVKFDAEMEKISLSEEDFGEEDDIYEKI